jgi:hypothetical protein
MVSPNSEIRRKQDSALTGQSTGREDSSRANKAINAFQIAVALDDENQPTEALEKAKKIILNWASEKFGIPQNIDSDTTLETPNCGIETVTTDDGNIWGAKIEHHPADQVWRTIHEVQLIVRPAGVDLNYRQTIQKYPGPEHRAPREIPSFINEIAQHLGLMDGHQQLDGRPWVIENEVDLEDFYEFLTSADRKLPVYMVTETHRSSAEYNTLIDFENLAERSIGLAHVALMSYQMGYEWTEKVGKWLSAYLGTVRTYQPNTPLDEANKHRHPLAMPDRIVNWEHEGVSGPKAFAKFLELQAMQASASPQNWRERFIPMSSIKAKELSKNVGFSEDAHWKDIEKRLLRKIELLESRIIEMSQEALTREAEHARLKAENAQQASKIYQLEKARPTPVSRLSNDDGHHETVGDTIAKHAHRLQVIHSALVQVPTTEKDQHTSAVINTLATTIANAFSHGEDPSTARSVRDALRSLNMTVEQTDHERNPYGLTFYDDVIEEDFIARWVARKPKTGDKSVNVYFEFDGNRQKIIVAKISNEGHR